MRFPLDKGTDWWYPLSLPKKFACPAMPPTTLLPQKCWRNSVICMQFLTFLPQMSPLLYYIHKNDHTHWLIKVNYPILQKKQQTNMIKR